MADNTPFQPEPFSPVDKSLTIKLPHGMPLHWLKTALVLGQRRLIETREPMAIIGGTSQYAIGEAVTAIDQIVQSLEEVVNINMQEEYAYNMMVQQQMAQARQFVVSDRPVTPDQDIEDDEGPGIGAD